MTDVALDIRRLTYADLPQVIAIERRAFPTPWSLAMFVLELSKPGGQCLAVRRDGALTGYVICSRYEEVWHIMNVAVDPLQLRRGIATALLEDLIGRLGEDARMTLEVRPVEPPGDRAVRALRLPRRRHAPPLLPGQRRGRPDHVAHARHARGTARRRAESRAGGAHVSGAGVVLGIETSCDDTCAAVVTRDGEIRSNIVSSQGVHDRFGGVVPEIAARQHLVLMGAVVEDALRVADVTLEDLGAVAVTAGPGLVGALLVGVASAKAIAASRGLPLIAVDHLQGHVAANFAAPDPFEPPFVCLIASGGHTFLARVEDRQRLRGARRHARRRRRRGVRQGRPDARPAVPRRAAPPAPRAGR